MSRTSIEIDDRLVREGLKLTRLKTKKDLVRLALEELVSRRSRQGLLKFEGKIHWRGNLDEMRESRT